MLSSPAASQRSSATPSQILLPPPSPPGSHLLSPPVSHFQQETRFHKEDRALGPRQRDEGQTEGKDRKKHFRQRGRLRPTQGHDLAKDRLLVRARMGLGNTCPEPASKVMKCHGRFERAMGCPVLFLPVPAAASISWLSAHPRNECKTTSQCVLGPKSVSILSL